jgi:hypothetical protein
MLLELLVLIDNEENRLVRFNPMLVETVEPDPNNPKACYITMQSGTYWHVQLSVAQYERKEKEFMRSNVMHAFYKREGS